MNARRVVYVVGLLITIISLTMAVPLVVAAIEVEEGAMMAFLWSICIGLIVGAVAILVGRSRLESFRRREGLMVVGLAWSICALVGCLPYVFSGVIPSFVDAYFETMSGFTTTGASVLRDVEHLPSGEPTPRSILFWRCMTNWLGGVGIVVLFVALLPALGVGGRLLFHFEVPGVGEKGFMPHIRQTASTLWTIYVVLTLAVFVSLMVCGMDWFDASCHALATLATGGFSSRSASIGHWDSTAIHVVITLFMFLAGVNFTLYFKIADGRWRAILKDPELRLYAAIFLVATAIIAWDLSGTADGRETAVRDSAFQVATISTTTGFATRDFDQWPPLSRMVLVLLMFCGGCAGSTAGGLKCVRIALVVKFMMRQVRLHVRPRSVEHIRFGGNTVGTEAMRSVIAMFLLFIMSFAVGALALAAMGLDLTTSCSASIAALGNIGPGLGSVGPACHYADIPAAGKMLLTVLMLVGRLEIFTVLSLFTPVLWRD